MFTTAVQQEFDQVLKTFTKEANKTYDYAFVAGYLNSLCVEMIHYLPKRKQRELINDMMRSTLKQVEVRNAREEAERKEFA